VKAKNNSKYILLILLIISFFIIKNNSKKDLSVGDNKNVSRAHSAGSPKAKIEKSNHELGVNRVSAKQKSEERTKTIYVYITKTGKKYHRKDCSYLRKSIEVIRLVKAITRGYTPCSRCKPPAKVYRN
jgi:hypothetical protein